MASIATFARVADRDLKNLLTVRQKSAYSDRCEGRFNCSTCVSVCRSRLWLAYEGLRDEHSHTSNGKAFIGKYVPNIVVKGYTEDLHRSATDSLSQQMV